MPALLSALLSHRQRGSVISMTGGHVHLVVLFLTCSVLMGCAVNKTLVPTGGSKADGTVDLSYEFGAFEKPVVNMAQAQPAAQQRCQAWGYSNAEPFGGEKRLCQAFDGYGGCVRTLVTVTFQCTGGQTQQ
jgi:hypothetical protein